MKNYFFLCDSPTLESGFARVSQNLLPRFDLPNKNVWALGYNGEPHNFQNVNLYPANVNTSWETDASINNFFNWIFSFHGEKVLWTLHDPFRLRKFSVGFERFKQEGGRIVSYVPVDSPLEPEDIEFFKHVDVIVAYTHYGKKEIEKIVEGKPIFVIGHGYDPAFYMLPDDNIEQARRTLFADTEDKCLIGVVNSNTERKALHRSLQVLRELNEISEIYTMYFHCSLNGHYDLLRLARHLGVDDSSIIFGHQFFESSVIGQSSCNKEMLNAIYNCFDLFLATPYGEGWGLTVSEAASCQTSICIPENTVFPELYGENSALWIPTGGQTAHYNNRIVPDINPKVAARIIDDWVEEEYFLDDMRINAKEDVLKHNWDEIGELWNTIFKRL